MTALLPFAGCHEVSALEGTNLTEVDGDILAALPEGPKYYPDDMVTDQPERFVAAELIREKVLQLTHEEIPHSTAVVIEEMSERERARSWISGPSSTWSGTPRKASSSARGQGPEGSGDPGPQGPGSPAGEPRLPGTVGQG
jgi:GTPase